MTESTEKMSVFNEKQLYVKKQGGLYTFTALQPVFAPLFPDTKYLYYIYIYTYLYRYINNEKE